MSPFPRASTLYQVHQYHSNNGLKFQISKKAPSLLTGLRCIGGAAGLELHWAGIPAGLSTPCQVHQYNSNNSLNSRYKKAPVIADEASLYWRSGWAGTPAGLSTPCQVHQYNSNNSLNFRYKKAPSLLTRLRCIGGADGTRTRDPRRDRPVF